MVEISTSILTVEKEKATKTFYDLEVAGTDYYHIDIMDGKFVEKNTEELMYEYASTIKQISNLPLDVHLMVEDIKPHIEDIFELKEGLKIINPPADWTEEFLKTTFSIVPPWAITLLKMALSLSIDQREEWIVGFSSFPEISMSPNSRSPLVFNFNSPALRTTPSWRVGFWR